MSHSIYAYEWAASYSAELPVMVALHGFTGTKETFRPLAQNFPQFNWLLIDQMGHGESPKHVGWEHFSYEQVLVDLARLLEQLEIPKYGLIGYSMGARIALGWAATYPDRVTTLILESGSPGLETKEDRFSRKQNDAHLADRLTSEPLVSFIDFWQNLPLFDSQKHLDSETRQTIRSERLLQDPIGLANSLLGMGTGSQPSYWTAMATISARSLYIYGELDTKFAQIAQKMHQRWQNLTIVGVANAGHCVHIEKPSEFEHIIATWLEEKMRDEDCKS